MYKFHFQPADGYLGDCIPFYWEGEYHVFYLKGDLANKGVENLSWSHIASRDLLHWEELPDALHPGENADAPDHAGCWSGSVIHHEGTFYIFYAGVRGLNTDAFAISTCLAKSNDLIHFQKCGRPLITSLDERWYSGPGGDPFVFWNQQDNAFWMLLNTRNINQKPASRSGCIALAKSHDLLQWQSCEPFYSPGTVSYPEVPELFHYENHWYLLYSETADFNRTHYRLSDNITGPWRMPPTEDCLDTSEFYAARTFSDGTQRYALAWIRRKENDKDEGLPSWGGAMAIPRKLTATSDGSLKVYYPDSWNSIPWQHQPMTPKCACGTLEQAENNFTLNVPSNGGGALAICELTQDHCCFKCAIDMHQAAAYCGFIFRANDSMKKSYRIRFDRPGQRIVAQYLGSGAMGSFGSPMDLAQRPLKFDGSKQIDFEMFIDSDIVEVFINKELAMSFRAHKHPGNGLAFFSDGGQASFTGCKFNHLV